MSTFPTAFFSKHVFVCTNQKPAGKTCCANTGGEPYVDYLKKRLVAVGLHGPGQYRVSRTGCLGRCDLGPSLVIYPEGVWYTYASFDDIDDIINTHLMKGSIVERLLMDPTK